MSKYLLIIFICLSSVGCAAYRAASNEGVDVSDIKDCKSKACLLTKGMELVQSRELEGGNIIEIFRAVARKSGANYFRAAGHGALSVMTLGMWEVAGNPIEGALSNNRGFIVAQAKFANKTSEEITELTIYDADGNKVENTGAKDTVPKS